MVYVFNYTLYKKSLHNILYLSSNYMLKYGEFLTIILWRTRMIPSLENCTYVICGQWRPDVQYTWRYAKNFTITPWASFDIYAVLYNGDLYGMNNEKEPEINVTPDTADSGWTKLTGGGVTSTELPFTPVLSMEVTGTPIVTAFYTLYSPGTIYIDIKIDPNGGTVGAIAGTSGISGLPYAAGQPQGIIITNADNLDTSYNNGLIKSGTTLMALPTIAPTSNVIAINGFYSTL